MPAQQQKSPIKSETTGKNWGFGKVILFGEHVVVHGAPAIVAGVSEYTDCHLKVLPNQGGLHVIDNRPAVPGYKKNKREEQKLSHDLVLKHLGITVEKQGLELTLGGPLVPSSGIGASASDVVSLSRALNELYGLGMNDEEINKSAYEGERGYHGTPSGVDNTAATFGGLISYRRTAKGPQFAPINTPKPMTMFLVVVSTGITASTTKVVAEVTQLKKSKPEWWKKTIIAPYNQVLKKAGEAMANGDLKLLGEALDNNHRICQCMTISCPELEDIVTQSKKYGALGAKMSGTGRGGIAVALCPDAGSQDAVASGLKQTCKNAKFVWKYSVETGSSSKI